MKTRKQTKQGISLIVLVITIIVMIILAAAIIISLDNGGVINRANEAVNSSNAGQVQQLASMIWAEAYLDKVANIDEEYIKEKLQENKIDTSKYDIQVAENGVTVKLKYKVTIDDRNVISLGTATTTLDATKAYVPGSTFTVTSEMACVVAISTDNGVSYTELGCVAVEGVENTYLFTIPKNIKSDFQIGIVLVGDADGSGEVHAPDYRRIKGNAVNGSLYILAADVYRDGIIDENDIDIMKNYTLGIDKTGLTWNII